MGQDNQWTEGLNSTVALNLLWVPEVCARLACRKQLKRNLRVAFRLGSTYYATLKLHNKSVIKAMKIVQTIEIEAPLATVWKAIIDHRKFGEWFRCKLDQPFAAGEWSTGMMTYPGSEHVKWEAKVLRIEQEKCLEFTWPPYVPDESVDLANEPWLHCTFELQATDDGTRVTITESGFEKLSPAIRDEARRGNEQGWEIQAGHIRDYVAQLP